MLWEKETSAHYPALLRLGCGHLLHPDVGRGLLKSRGLHPKTGRGEAANNPRGTRQTLLWLAVGLQPRGPMDRRVSGQTAHRPSASESSAAGDSCLLTLVTLPASSPSGAWSTWRSLSPGSTALRLRLSWCPDSRQLSSAQPGSEDQSVNLTSCHHAPLCDRLLATPQRDQTRRCQCI